MNFHRSTIVSPQPARTALGTPTPTAPRGSPPDNVHSLSGVLIGQPGGLSAVLCPHTIEHFEETFPFGGEYLITVKVDHGHHRFSVLFHNDSIFLAGNPPNQLGSAGLGAFLIHRFSHGQIVVGSFCEVK